MQTLHPRVLKNLIRQIEPYIVTDKMVIDEWKSRTGSLKEAGNIVLDDSPEEVMHLGDRWKAGYDDTRFFSADVTVPEEMDGKKIYLVVDFGGESIVRINGEIVGAVSSKECSGWQHRTEILFKDKAKKGDKLSIEVEGAVNCGGFCDDAIAGAKYAEYVMKNAALVAVDEAAESYWFDITTAYDVYENTEDEYVKSRLFIAIDDSTHEIDFDLGEEAFLASVGKATEKLWTAVDKINYDSPGKVIMDGHSHLDVAWLWTVKEITRKTARTFANNLKLMDIYPDFKFTQSQAVLFDFMKQYYPDIFEQVKEKVKSGQWEIVGNAWVEADTNIASGESLIRQLLYGREFFLKEFGVSSDTYWLPDCFGFTWALPQIIKRSGMKNFLTSKLQNNDTNEFPLSVFKWRAHSGDEVLAYMQKVGYEGDYNAEYIKDCRKSNRQNDVADVSFGMFGYGDGGGGCTYQMVEQGRRLSKLPGLPKSECGSVSQFFKEVEKSSDNLPVWDGEMYYENHRGTYTSQAFIKKNNRRGEYMMRNAEMLSIMAGDYDKEKLEKVWKILLINQFHDILPGTSIHEVIENTRSEYAEFRKLAGEIIDSSLDKLCAKLKLEENSVLVWNMLAWNSNGLVTVEIPMDNVDVTDENGRELVYYIEKKDGKNILTFYADYLKATGCTIFKLKKRTTDILFDKVYASESELENEYLRVELDENGLIDSIFDKENNRQILTGKGNLMSVSQDKPIHESAWNLELNYQKKMTFLEKADSIEVIESSPVRAVVRVVRSYNNSKISQDIILEKNSRTVDFETTVDWTEREKVLKAQFPVDVRSRSASYEIAHGATEYPTHYNTSYDQAKFECCAHKWADLSEGGYGVSIINDCKYGYDIHDNLMRITLMRGPICPDPKGDIGTSTFRYSFYPHAGTWREADTVKLAFRENIRPYVRYSEWNTNYDTETKPFISVSADNVILDAVKMAQDGKGMIIRLYEAETRHTTVTVNVDSVFTVVKECNLMEEDERAVPHASNAFTFKIKPHEVKTFRLS